MLACQRSLYMGWLTVLSFWPTLYTGLSAHPLYMLVGRVDILAHPVHRLVGCIGFWPTLYAGWSSMLTCQPTLLTGSRLYCFWSTLYTGWSGVLIFGPPCIQWYSVESTLQIFSVCVARCPADCAELPAVLEECRSPRH